MDQLKYQERLVQLFEDLEEDEPESDFEPEMPLPGVELVRSILLFIAEENNMKPNFIDCSHYAQDKLPETADDLELELMPSRSEDDRVYRLPLRDVPPFFDHLFPNAFLKIGIYPQPLRASEQTYQIEVDLCTETVTWGYKKENEIETVASVAFLQLKNGELSYKNAR